MHFRLALPVLFTAAACCLPPAIAHAAWPHDTYVGNVLLSTAPGDKAFPVSLADGAGGTFVAWFQYSANGADIAVQHVSASGTLLWGPNGAVLTALAGDQYAPTICSDGAGGVIATWNDQRTGINDIYAQRVSAAGTPLWTANGVPICTAGQNQFYPSIVADGAGGAILSWWDYRLGAGTADIFVQRVNGSGAALWAANGVSICSATNIQENAKAVSDGAGGAIVAWADRRSGSADIYAQRVNAAGAPQWAANGVVLCNISQTQDYPSLIPDGAGGAIVAWQDFRTGTDWDVYAQRINAAGNPQWTVNGVGVCVASIDQDEIALAPDATGGAILAWRDFRSGTDYDVFAQRINGSGATQWNPNGVSVAFGPTNQELPAVTSDGMGGAIVAWAWTPPSGTYDIAAQHLTAAGATTWTAGGASICSAVADQKSPTIVTDGAAGAIVAWFDVRSGVNEIYAQRIERFGFLGPEPSIASVRDVPNDQGGSVKVSWYASWLDQTSDPNLTAYDVYRSVPGSLAQSAIEGGARRLASFAEASAAGERAFVVEPASTQLYAWEYVGTTAAVHFPSAYSLVTPTTSDSLPASNPRTVFMVVGRNFGSMYWPSAPDSGYSVDNLGPAAPAPFLGTYSGGTTAMHWRANVESDLDHYELYRGISPSFVPGAGNHVAATPDTNYTDPAGQPYYYKLAAVDIHGNTSGYTLLLPGGTTGVAENEAAARALLLGSASPNPMVAGTTFHFALARATRMSLAIFDERGRRVRDLVGGTLPAGDHGVRWDGRDDAGRRTASGIYFGRLEAEGRTLMRRFAVIH